MPSERRVQPNRRPARTPRQRPHAPPTREPRALPRRERGLRGRTRRPARRDGGCTPRAPRGHRGRIGQSKQGAGHSADLREVHELPCDAADPRLPLIEDAEDAVEIGRVDQTVVTVRIQRTCPSARVAIRALVWFMMAHLDPEALRHVVEPEVELRLNALAERIAQVYVVKL